MSTETVSTTTAAPAPAVDTRQLLTSSRLKAARACRRMHQLLYMLAIRSAVEPETTRFGTLVHLGLEAWWNAAKQGLTGDGLLLAMSLAIGPEEVDPFDRVRAEEMLRGYHYRWSEDLQHYEILSVEAQFETDLVNPITGHASKTWKLGGKIDVIIRDRRDGRVLVVEHKTSSEDIAQGSEYWRRLRMDGQVSIYFVGATSLDHEVGGCLYDVLGKPGIKPSQVPLVDADGVKIVLDAAGERVRTKDGKKFRETGDAAQGFVLQTRAETVAEFRSRLVDVIAKDPDGYFQRGEVVRLEQDLRDALLDIWQLAQELRQAELVSRFPRNPGACTQFGRTCAYFDLCTNTASIDDPTRFKRIENVHPELEVDHAS